MTPLHRFFSGRRGPMRAIVAVACLGVLSWSAFRWWKNNRLANDLRVQNEASAGLDDFDGWLWLIRRIVHSNDPDLVQAAFEVEILYWYKPAQMAKIE